MAPKANQSPVSFSLPPWAQVEEPGPVTSWPRSRATTPVGQRTQPRPKEDYSPNLKIQ